MIFARRSRSAKLELGLVLVQDFCGDVFGKIAMAAHDVRAQLQVRIL